LLLYTSIANWTSMDKRSFLRKRKEIFSTFTVLILIVTLTVFPMNLMAYAATTTISSNTTLFDYINATGDTVVVNSGVTLTLQGNFTNLGTIENHGTITLAEGGGRLNNWGGTINDYNGATFFVGLGSSFDNRGTINNDLGGFIQHSLGSFVNNGTMHNAGTIRNTEGDLINGINGIINNEDSGLVQLRHLDNLINHGLFNNNGTLSIDVGVSVHNSGTIKNFCSGVFENNGSFTGNPVEEIPCPGFPIIHMEDTTQSFGLSTHSGRQINAEFVSATSQLIGDEIDSITLKLRKAGLPTGLAQIGVFNSDLAVKKLFGTLNVATLTSTYTDYTFTIGGDELYTIAAGDRIGIKFTGGNSANSVAVMMDNNAADPFDGTSSYRQQYTTSWQSFTSEDLYMILKQTHAPTTDPDFPVTQMSDTTITIGLSTFSGRQAHVELVSSSSQLIGDKIDSMTVRLKKSGSPTGTVEIGIFNSDLSIKKQFGILDPSTLTTGYADYTFSLDIADLYTIQSGDRIGIKYSGGNSANFVAIMTDNNAADPFDGSNSYRQHYTTAWQSFMAEDLYMVLLQTHG
jgi:hypothetical protein